MNKKSRNGKHRPMKTLFGAYVEPDVKALAIMVSDRLGITFTEIILNGLNAEATRAGLMKNGELLPEFKSAFNAILEIVKVEIINRKAK